MSSEDGVWTCECGQRSRVSYVKGTGRCPKCGERYPPVPKNHSRPELDRRLRRLGPECAAFVEALQGQSVAFAHENLDRYDAADAAARLDMLAFFDSEGPRRIGELRKRHEDGTPTSGDLAKWFDGEHGTPGGAK